MPFNGSGTFNRVYSWQNDANNSINITASRVDTEDNGFATGLSNCLCKDGQQTNAANQNWGAFKITNMGNGSATTDSVALGQVMLLTGTQTMSGALNEINGSDIASASTINLTTATGNYVQVTGTTTITAITLAVGARRTVKFTGILTLTNNAAIILPGGANITTAAGDTAEFWGVSTGVICAYYTRASGGTLVAVTVPNGGTGATTLTAHGVLLGEGTSAIAATAVMSNGQLLIGQTGADPLPKTIGGGINLDNTGNVTFVAGTIPGSALASGGVTNTQLANMAANSIKLNNTGSPAAPIDGTVTQLKAMLNTTFSSTGNAFVASGATSVAHGLGATPVEFWVNIRCTTADQGYSVGDVIGRADAAGTNGLIPFANATQVGFVAGGALAVLNKTNGGVTTTTSTNWTLDIYARLNI